MQSAGITDKSDELLGNLSDGSTIPAQEIIDLSRKGKSPCRLFLNSRDREECEVGSLVVGILDSGREPSIRERTRISDALKGLLVNDTTEIRDVIVGHPEKIDRSFLERLVRSGFFK